MCQNKGLQNEVFNLFMPEDTSDNNIGFKKKLNIKYKNA